jgi:hypothetical protein
MRSASVRVGLVAALLAACDQSAFDPPAIGEDPPPGPGSPTWDDTDLSCATEADCAPGETCDQNSCRPRQCDDGPYESAVPLGPSHLFFREEDLLVLDGNQSQGSYWIDGYDAAGAISYTGAGGGSFSIGTAALTDVAKIHAPSGGSGMVVAIAGSSSVTRIGRAIPASSIATGIVPVAVAGGDVDGDGTDDIVALSAAGQIAICQQTGGCSSYSFTNGPQGIDVATGDTNGDGVDEVAFLLRTGDTSTVAVWQPTVEDGMVAASFDVHFQAITAGDVDRDGRAEIAALEDRGWLGFASDRVHVYAIGAGFTGLTAVSTTGSAVDLSAGDLDGSDQGASLVVLGDNQSVDVLRWNGSTIASAYTGSVGTTASPRRIAVGDSDDDSASAKLVAGPDLIAGKLVPTMVVTFPPYDSTVSSSEESGVAVGNRVEMSESFTDTISLSAGVEVGVDADFLGLFKAKLSTKLSTEVSRSRTLGRQVSVGTKFSLRPQPALYGNQYAAVVVACNCFHTYEYELVDPANRAGGTGHRFTLVVPVGGQTTVLSTPRYNALAAHHGDLPAVTVPTRIGDVASYPTSPEKLDGTPVEPDEHVFPVRPTLRASDVGTVGFSLSVGTSETNAVALSTSVSVSASVSALGMSVGGDLGVGWGTSYAITIGESAEFSGEIPPLPDDPATQEDEYAARAYSFAPYVYRQSYRDPVSDEPTGYYVIDYAVGPP